MKCINRNILFPLFQLFVLQSSGQESIKSSPNSMYGQWKVNQYFWWENNKYGDIEIDKIKSSILNIKRNKIYFDKIEFIDTCFYSKLAFKTFFRGTSPDSEYPEDYQYMLIKYSKEELKSVIRIEANCQYNCLGYFYLKQDTLILNFCGGLTIFMLKQNENLKREK